MNKMILEYKKPILESKEDREKFKQWIKDGALEEYPDSLTNSSAETQEQFAERVLDNFLSLKQRIKAPYNDFYYWMKNHTFEEFYSYLRELQADALAKDAKKKQEKEGAELIYSDKEWKVYHITNYEASAKYGKGTKWCITGTERWNDGTDGKETFLDYHEKNHVEFYFFIKNGTEKYALALYPDGKSYELFNAEDVSISYIPDAPLVDGLPDISVKDDKKMLINAIASDKISDDIILNAIEELAMGSTDDYDEAEFDITFALSPQAVASMLSEMIPDCYIEYNAVADGRMTPEEYHEITGDTISETDINNGYVWGGDLPEIYLDDKFKTKAEACNPDNYKGHKYWYFFLDRNSWNPTDLYFADDKVGLYNSIRQLLGFDDMTSFLEAVADIILRDVKTGKVSKDAITNIGVSDEYLDSLEIEESLHESSEKFSKMLYHGSSTKFTSFDKEINWLTTDYDYAKYYALSLSDNGYVYSCNASLNNLFDMSNTGYRVYELLPIKPYKISKKFLLAIESLNLSEEELRKLLSDVTREWNLEADGYNMKASTVARSTAFKRILESKGYKGIKAVEYNVPKSRYCDTYGIFDGASIKIEDIEEVEYLPVESLSESLNESRKAITFGDLDYAKKTDTRGIQMNGRGTGHFGTGFYFVGADGKYGLDANGNPKYDYEPTRPIYEIDLDAYNLFKPRDNDSAYKIHDCMREINNAYEPSLKDWLFKDFNIDKLEDELFNIGWKAQEVDEDIEDDDLDLDIDDLEDLVDDKDELSDEELDRIYEEKYRKGIKEFIKKYGLEEYVWIDIDNEKPGKIENHVKDAIHAKYSSIHGLMYALKILSKELNVDSNKLLDIIEKSYNNKNSTDTISTEIFKALGYEGVDVTHLNHDDQGLSGLDNFSYGTVIYDLKPGTFKRIKEPRKSDRGYYKDTTENLSEEMKDDKLIVYRVGQVDDFKEGLFFADSLDYYDHSDTGYSREDAEAYELDLSKAKIFDPMKEWDLVVNTWSDIRQEEEFFKEKDYPYYNLLDDLDYDDPDEYHEVTTDTDYLALWAHEEGYDVVILRDIPGDGGRGPDQTEYCVFNKSLIRPVKLNESEERYKTKDNIDFKIYTECTGSHDGQRDYIKIAYKGDNWLDNNDRVIRENLLGYLEYAIYEDTVYIQMIEVKEEERHKDIATQLIKSLYKQYSDKEINWGMTTDDGTELRKSLISKGVIKEAVEATDQEILDALDKEFGQEDVYMWSTYILPNGHFLNPDNSKWFDEINEDPAYEHCDFEDWAWSHGYRNLSAIYNNCVKMNVTDPYIGMPDKARPTQEQMRAVKEILSNYQDSLMFEYHEWDNMIDRQDEINAMGPRVLGLFTPVGDKAFDLDVSSADDIVKAINLAYVRGSFLGESLTEAKGKDTFIFEGKKAWSGAVNTLDGVIEEVHSYKEAEEVGFHHSFYFSDEQLELMEEGLSCFFCIFNDGKIMINAMCRFNPEDEGIELDEKFLEDRIKEQVKIITNESLEDYEETSNFKLGTAGYILENGNYIYMDEYHGEDSSFRDLGLPEFSNTHCEEDTCVRIFKEPNEVQYKKLEEVIDKYLDTEEYCKVEIGNDFYNVYSLREDACQDPYYDEKIGNWTGYKLVQIIKNYFNRNKAIDEDLYNKDFSLAKFEEYCKNNFSNELSKDNASYFIFPDGYIIGTPNFHEDIVQSYVDYTDDLDKDADVESLKDDIVKAGTIRCTGHRDEHYVTLPPKMTRAQYESLRDFLDYYQDLKAVAIEDWYNGTLEQQMYFYNETTVDDIIDNIKRYYISGKLEEGYNDLDGNHTIWLKGRTIKNADGSKKQIKGKFVKIPRNEVACKIHDNLTNLGFDVDTENTNLYYYNASDDISKASKGGDIYISPSSNPGVEFHVRIVDDNYLQFREIYLDDDKKGQGIADKLIKATLDAIDSSWQVEVHVNLNNKFWSHMAKKYPNYKWTGVSITDESLIEMKGKGNISNEKIVKYVEECIEELKKLTYESAYDYLYITFDDIDLEEGDTTRTFGTMFLPRMIGGNFKLVLNKHMFDESEEAIKNTIYHELCHYIVDKIAIEKGIYFMKNGHWYINKNNYYANDYKGHGRKWKEVASIVGSAVGQDITRTNNYDMHTGVGAHAEDKYKYIVKCKHCGNEFKYTKRTKFIDAVLDGNGHTDNWWCNCSDGTKGHDFEILKGK